MSVLSDGSTDADLTDKEIVYDRVCVAGIVQVNQCSPLGYRKLFLDSPTSLLVRKTPAQVTFIKLETVYMKH